jgi:hypothetical protein
MGLIGEIGAMGAMERPIEYVEEEVRIGEMR